MNTTMYKLLAVLVLCVWSQGCGIVETVSSDTSSHTVSVSSDDFDKLWDATLAVIGREYTIVEKDKQRGMIVGRRVPADTSSFQNRARAYPDVSDSIVRAQIRSDGRSHFLKIVAVQQPEFPTESRLRPQAPDRSTHVREPHYMGRYSNVEQEILRQVEAELEARSE